MTKFASIELTVSVWTDLSIGFVHPNENSPLELLWLPLSKIENKEDLDWKKTGRKLEIVLPEWLVIAEGIDPYVEEVEE